MTLEVQGTAADTVTNRAVAADEPADAVCDCPTPPPQSGDLNFEGLHALAVVAPWSTHCVLDLAGGLGILSSCPTPGRSREAIDKYRRRRVGRDGAVFGA